MPSHLASHFKMQLRAACHFETISQWKTLWGAKNSDTMSTWNVWGKSK